MSIVHTMNLKKYYITYANRIKQLRCTNEKLRQTNIKITYSSKITDLTGNIMEIQACSIID